MDLHYLKKIVRLVEQSTVDEIEIEEEGIKIRVAKSSFKGVPMQQMMQPMPAMSDVPQHGAPAKPAAEPVAAPVPASNHHEVRSPIVGTFYRSPAPDADPYVQVGQIVEKGTVICIIEAMKLMNEIESDVSGRIVKILVDNAKPVEYNQPLLVIEPV